jgi:hypothetical protein
MNVEFKAEAAQLPEKEYINGIYVAVCTERFSINYILKVNVTSKSKEIITLVLAYAVQPVDYRVIKLEKITDFS